MTTAVGHLVLAIDAAGPAPGVALAKDGDVVCEAYTAAGTIQGEQLAAVCATVLEQGRVCVSELAAIAVVRGPGSYTGVRLGLALAHGLALVDRLPLVGLDALEALAAAAEPRTPCVYTVLDAGVGRVYLAAFAPRDASYDRCDDSVVVSVEQAIDRVRAQSQRAVCSVCALAGEAWNLMAAALAAEQAAGRVLYEPRPARRAGELALLGARAVARGAALPAQQITPTYVGETRAQPNRQRVARCAPDAGLST